MPVRDLFRACPICGRPASLRPDRRIERCEGCHACFRRGRGSMIEAHLPDGGTIALTPLEWLERIPNPRSSQEAGLAIGPERVRIRLAVAKEAVRRRGELLGWIERLGPPLEGNLRLDEVGLHFSGHDGKVIEWPLDRITAVQPSSTSLQIKARGRPVAAFRFLDSSLRYWEDFIHLALRNRYRMDGRGEIVEFQPHILTK